MNDLLTQINHSGSLFLQALAFDPALLSEPEMIARLMLQALLLCASAFFSSSETALFSLSRMELQQLRRDHHPKFETLEALLEQPRRLIISILSGNEVINVAATANMAGILISIYGETQAGLLNVLIMVPLLLLFGEVTPKTIAVSNPVRLSTRVIASPMTAWVKLIAPLRWVVRQIADRLTTAIVGKERAAENILRLDELRTLIDEVVAGGELNAMEKEVINNLLVAGSTEVIEIMKPRTQTAFISAELSVAEIIEQAQQIRHTRIAVYHTHHDNLIGFIHAEDILDLVLNDVDLDQVKLDAFMHPPVIVPPTKKVDEMFDFFIDNNAHAAAVLNEHGGIEGFITMRTVLNFIFGEAATTTQPYKQLAEDVYEIPGDMTLTEFNDLTNFSIDDPRMTTVAGVVLRQLDRLPESGDSVTIEGIVFTVTAMEGLRITQLKISKGDITEQAEED